MKQPISINDLISSHAEEFTGFELELANSLKEYIKSHCKQVLNVSVMVDTTDPVASQVENTLILRYNGRFYSQDPSGLGEHVEKWAKTFPIDLEIKSDKSLYKFTVKYPSILLPELKVEEPEEELSEDETSEEPSEFEPSEEEPESPESDSGESEEKEPPLTGEEVEKEIEQIEEPKK